MHAWFILLLALAGTTVTAQVPQPFPKPGQQQPTPPAAPAPQTTKPVDPALPPVVQTQTAAEPAQGSLGVPVYPTATFIASYDAGKGQRYYLYGTPSTFGEIVQYYRNTLKQRGDLVFEEPPIHQFDIGRFREETMAFPPSVTVKDYTWGGSAGYLVPRADGKPVRFATIIQIVPNPPAVAR